MLVYFFSMDVDVCASNGQKWESVPSSSVSDESSNRRRRVKAAGLQLAIGDAKAWGRRIIDSYAKTKKTMGTRQRRMKEEEGRVRPLTYSSIDSLVPVPIGERERERLFYTRRSTQITWVNWSSTAQPSSIDWPWFFVFFFLGNSCLLACLEISRAFLLQFALHGSILHFFVHQLPS